MIFVFGSLHIDPDEERDLITMLSKIDKKGGIIAIEIANNNYTINCLKRFKSLRKQEIDKVLEYQFGKRQISATFNFIKLLSNCKNINLVESIEPPEGKVINKLTKDELRFYNLYEKRLKEFSEHSQDKRKAYKLLDSYSDFMKKSFLQSQFRERNMMQTILSIQKKYPKRDLFVYTGLPHAAYIKKELSKRKLRFIERPNKAASLLEKDSLKVREIVFKSNKKHNYQNKLKLARDMLFDYIVWTDQKDMSIKRYYSIFAYIKSKVKSLDSYSKAVGDIKGFKADILEKTNN